eukprot:1534472-Rhodomonas_salina.1
MCGTEKGYAATRWVPTSEELQVARATHCAAMLLPGAYGGRARPDGEGEHSLCRYWTSRSECVAR